MGTQELIAGFECFGNRRPIQGLIGNGKWTGVPLKTLLENPSSAILKALVVQLEMRSPIKSQTPQPLSK